MSEGETPKTPKKKAKKAKRNMDHPKYLEMIIEAIETMQDEEKKGSSRQAIVKYIRAHFKINDENVEIYVKNALKMGLKYERLILATGRGVSGSFRVSDAKTTSRKPGARIPGVVAAETTLKSTRKVTKPKNTVKRPVPVPVDKGTRSEKTESRDAKPAKPAKPAKSKTVAKRSAKAKPKATKKRGKKSKKKTG
jgi:histone H1/5